MRPLGAWADTNHGATPGRPRLLFRIPWSPWQKCLAAREEEALCTSSQSCRWALRPALGRNPGATWGGRQSLWEGPAPGALCGCTLPPSQAPPAHLLG